MLKYLLLIYLVNCYNFYDQKSKPKLVFSILYNCKKSYHVIILIIKKVKIAKNK